MVDLISFTIPLLAEGILHESTYLCVCVCVCVYVDKLFRGSKPCNFSLDLIACLLLTGAR
jgi:hypothetical protein